MKKILGNKFLLTCIVMLYNNVLFIKRPYPKLRLIVWMDGIVFKVRENGKVINKMVYLCVGLNKDGFKEVLVMWVGKTESASFWIGVLTDLKARAIEDILITVTDNLNGFTDTIKSVFPDSTTHICVVHQIRNSSRYVVWKEKREFTADLKSVYNAPTKDAADRELDLFEQKWGSKYPYAIRSWRNNWDELTSFYDFPGTVHNFV